MKNLPDKNSLVSAYFKYLLPLPARPSLNAPKDDGAVKILTGRTGMTATRETPKRPPLSAGPPGHQPTNKRRAPSPSLDSLVIISNPNWPTSGQSAPTTNNYALGEQGCTPAGDTKCSGPTATTSQPNPAPPLKRPKLKRSFSNLKR
ncbi:unnamed protein product [Schistocephalus solidus]|uniref:Uncharacterized protein n=1 Tax=Schistocephalus solidus TaxID=70667 RepID=A0A183SLK1_SCHSO|nr:unnamed protein product [Schistocephalus solidus]